MLLSDIEIIRACQPRAGQPPLIHPFVPEQIRPVQLSYGLGSYGYDMRNAGVWDVWEPVRWYRPAMLYRHLRKRAQRPRRVCGDLWLAPGAFALTHSRETFTFPRDVTGLVWGKSSLARRGVHILVTPLEAGWAGEVVVEIANLSSSWYQLHAGEGIAQAVFAKGSMPCLTSYAERAGGGGRYQGQTGITPASPAAPTWGSPIVEGGGSAGGAPKG